jgi:MoaA/NifB/PqqE/SkfB family radical SAM enzyme
MGSGRRLDLKLGFACNNRCVFCAQGDKRKSCGARPYDVLVEELARARPECSGVVFTGGEPTLHKQLLRLVSAARALGYSSIQLQTNGRMLAYPSVVEKLVDAGVTEFSPSLHGSCADVHESLTAARGSFRDSLSGIANAVGSGAVVITNTVITKDNTDRLSEIVALLGSVGVQQAQLAFVHPVGTALERFEEVVPRLPDVVAPLRQARTVAGELGMRLVTEAVPLCFLSGMEELAVEETIPDTTVVDLAGRLDYSSWRVSEGKAHGPPCSSCAAVRRCEGPWREYPERWGWNEFQSLAADPVQSGGQAL